MLMPMMVVMVMVFRFFNCANNHFGLVPNLFTIPSAIIFSAGTSISWTTSTMAVSMVSMLNWRTAGIFPVWRSNNSTRWSFMQFNNWEYNSSVANIIFLQLAFFVDEFLLCHCWFWSWPDFCVPRFSAIQTTVNWTTWSRCCSWGWGSWCASETSWSSNPMVWISFLQF